MPERRSCLGAEDPSRREAWVWEQGSPKLEAGRQEAIAPPCLLPHHRYQAPETTERGTWPFLVLLSTPSCLQAQGSYWAHPTLPPTAAPKTPVLGRGRLVHVLTPRLPHVHLGCVVPHPRPLTELWDTRVDPPTRTHTLRRVPPRGAWTGPVPTSEPAALTVCPPPWPASAKLSPAPQVARGSDAEPGSPGSSLTCG